MDNQLDTGVPDYYFDNSKHNTSTNQQLQALQLYLAYTPMVEIGEKLCIGKNTVKDWIYNARNGMNSFSEIRKCESKEILNEVLSARMPSIKKIAGSVISIMENNFNHLAKTKIPLDIDGLKKLSEILSNIDRITRLDEGQATDNVAIANISMMDTIKDLRQMAKENDPFNMLKLEDITIEE